MQIILIYLLKNKNIQSISHLHYLIQDNVPGFSHAALAEIACKAGIKWVQLRVKGVDFDTWLNIAREVKAITDYYNSILIINDSLEIAMKIGADGVHLGKNDMPAEEARKIAGNNFIIGATANNEMDFEKALNSGADYIGLGPYKFTNTKENLSPVLGLARMAEMANKQSEIPVIAIGGIQLDDIGLILNSGIYGVAISSAINLADDKTQICRDALQCVSTATNKELQTWTN